MSKTLKILITGAARGIGMATAQVLANRGHSVVATDVSALSGKASRHMCSMLAEFLNVHMSELRKGGKDTITGQPQVDDFSALLRSE